MDPVRNPFAPGAGNPPPELAGRSDLLESLEISLRRVAIGRPAQSSILVGLRGVGKTVLLNRAKSMANDEGYRTLSLEVHEGRSLPDLLVPGLRSALQSMSITDGAKDLARRGLRVLKSFLRGGYVKFSEIELGLSVEPEHGTADSGNLETDLPDLLCAVGQASRAASKPFAILLDELQYLSPEEFSALIMAMHRINQASLPITVIGAGLPQIVGLAGESKSYSERLFRFRPVGELREEDARFAIERPVEQENASITPAAVNQILETSQRYPYFIQQWAHDSWNAAAGNAITLADVMAANQTATVALDDSFFRVRFDRCTPSERKYMRALAELGAGPHRSGDIATTLGTTTQTQGPTRSALIKKGMIYSPQHGDTAFTVPMFDAYMRRAMPGEKPSDWL